MRLLYFIVPLLTFASNIRPGKDNMIPYSHEKVKLDEISSTSKEFSSLIKLLLTGLAKREKEARQ